jgi:hypothetical protein
VRFLIDNALSPQVARKLSEAGHDALHVHDIDLQHASDTEIFERAQHGGSDSSKWPCLAYTGVRDGRETWCSEARS